MTVSFAVAGDPAAVTARAGVMRARAVTFRVGAEGLSSITTAGWSGRAADRFRERFDVEPQRWQEAADGFTRAAGALEVYAQALTHAQDAARTAKGEYARGEAVTASARAAYDADVARGQAAKTSWEAANGPGTYTLTIEPFTDPGQAIRDGAVRAFQTVQTDLEAAAHTCADEVRAGCAGAPEQRNWLETGLAFVGGILAGAGEAVWDLTQLVYKLQYGPILDLVDLATGDLTVEELAAKKQLQVEQVQAMWTALRTDPAGFGKNIGKAVLDWDTWADDPARAIGHLVPDAVVAFFTAGTGTAATRGGRALERTMAVLKDLSGYDTLRLGIKTLTPAELTRHLNDLDHGRLVPSLVDRQDPRYARPSQTTTDLLDTDVTQHGQQNVNQYIERMNPLYHQGTPWQYNCGPCSRAFADTYHGVEARVAPGDMHLQPGEYLEMRQWTNTNPTLLQYDPAVDADTTAFSHLAYGSVADAAKGLPDGTALIIGVDWDTPAGDGHWFNAIVENQQLRWVDAQTGSVGPWPPSGYTLNILGIDAVHRPDGTTPWKELTLDRP
jgi:uncharacterized protein YukE